MAAQLLGAAVLGKFMVGAAVLGKFMAGAVMDVKDKVLMFKSNLERMEYIHSNSQRH